MAADLWALLACVAAFAFAIGWQGLHLDWYAGVRHGLSSRDEAPEGIEETLAPRLNRIVQNHVEGLAMFAPMVFVAHAVDIQTGTMAWAAIIFAGTRALYTPAYAFGLSPWRSIIWIVGAIALLVYFISLVAAAI